MLNIKLKNLKTMCFKIDLENCPQELIAQSDITCYKVGFRIEETFRSYYFDEPYKKNKVKKIKKLKVIAKNDLTIYKIEEGLCSYMSFSKAMNFFCALKKNEIFKTLCIGEFIIPKGAKYYLNKYEGMYISDRIIFKNFVNYE